MTIYYQHIGERLTARDFPKSLGTAGSGLVRFGFKDIEGFLEHLTPLELLDIESKCSQLAPTGFQIWGIPSGAQRVLEKMQTGDFLMLLESTDFAYCGQVLHRITDMCPDLSNEIWGEQKFPIIILLQGEMISYGWNEFAEHFGFAPNYHMRGNTMSLSAKRVIESTSGTEEAFISSVLTTKGTNPVDQETDFRMFSDGLEIHLNEVKAREAQHQFRSKVFQRYGERCAVCDLDVPLALDAAHIVPKGEEGSDDPRNGIVLCAVHHRMYDANAFAFEPNSLNVILRSEYSKDWLRIKNGTINHLAEQPHLKALEWRWKRFQNKVSAVNQKLLFADIATFQSPP
jgi:hypothetical protein